MKKYLTITDFYAGLLPGTIVLFILFCIFTRNEQSTIAVVNTLLLRISSNPYVLIFLIPSAYILGNLVSAIRIDFAESVFLFRNWKDNFPYRNELRKGRIAFIKLNRKEMQRMNIPKLPQSIHKHFFHAWTDYVCACNIVLFERWKAEEVRVRFSAGMIWVSICGLIASGVFKYQGRETLLLEHIIVSAIIYMFYGLHLIRVRHREASILYLSYLTCRYHKLLTVKE